MSDTPEPRAPELSSEQVASARATWVAAGHDPARFDAEFIVGEAAPIQTTPATPGDLSPAQVASARATWVAAGLDPAKFDAEFNAAAPVVVPGEAPTGEEVYEPGTGTEPLTQAQADQLEATLLAGGMDPAQVAKELEAHGYVRDERTPEERAHDEEWGFGREYKPEEYKINYREAGVIEQHTTETMTASQAEWRDFLTGLQINPAIGTDLVERAIRNGQALAKMGDVDRRLWVAEQQAQSLRSAGSQEALTERNRLAGVAIKFAVDHGARAATIEALRAAGAFQDWFFVATLANHGRALEGWLKGV